MSYKLEKPYTDELKMRFIVDYNHKLGLKIEETENALFALEENEIMFEGQPILDLEYDLKQIAIEKARISKLKLTKREVELLKSHNISDDNFYVKTVIFRSEFHLHLERLLFESCLLRDI